LDAGDGAGDGAFVDEYARVDEFAFVRGGFTFGIVYNVVDDAVVGECVFVEEGAVVGEFTGALVNDDVVVADDAVVGDGAVVGEFVFIEDEALVVDGAVVGEFAVVDDVETTARDDNVAFVFESTVDVDGVEVVDDAGTKLKEVVVDVEGADVEDLAFVEKFCINC
jgi:NDP-sugar pyrophosphorylase family protein